MKTYTITITPAEDIALGYIAADQTEWISNVVHNRCRLAIEDIVLLCVGKCLENNIQIPGSKDEMVMLAKSKGWLEQPEVIINQG